MVSSSKDRPPHAPKAPLNAFQAGPQRRPAAGLLVMLLPLMLDATAYALPISYGGRLVDASGAPREGLSDIAINFYDAAEGGTRLGSSPYAFASTTLTQGVFSVDIELSDADVAAIFRDPEAPVWIEVTDKSSGTVYPRQRFGAVPYALKVPVDGATLGFDASGQLTVLSSPNAGSVPNPLPAVDGAALTNINASSLQGAPIAGAAPAAGQVLKWNGSAWAPAADTDTDTINPGTVTSITAGSGLTGGTITGSGTLAVDAGTGANQIVRLDAAAKLPAVDGSALSGVNAAKLQGVAVDSGAPAASQVLKYDGTKWAPAADANSGGTVTSITAGTGLTGGTITGSGSIALVSPMPALDGSALTNVNAVKLQGRTVAVTAPSDGHVLKWNESASSWEAAPDAGGAAGVISAGQNRGTSDATTADVYESTAAPNMRFRRLKEGAGVELTQNTDDVTVAVAAGGISAAELAVDSVGSDEIAADAVTASEIATDAVGSAEIAADAVTAIEIAADAVTSSEIATDAVGAAEIAIDAVTASEIAAGAVTTSEILDGTIAGADVSQSAALSVASLGVAAEAGVTLAPFDTAMGSTGEARFRELAANGTDHVAFKSPDALAGSVTYVLPDAAPASSGQVLSGSTAGVLSWTSLPTALPPSGAAGGDLAGSYPNPTLANSGVTAGTYPKVTVDAKGRVTSGSSTITSTDIADATIADADISGTAQVATSKLSGAVTAISGHGLGALATLNAVSTSEITDGTIANADIAGTAQVATSKLSGALTAVSGHGLGSLATLSAVGSSEITNGSIADADIAGNAAIATSKLSGAVTSISGHGLGSLASLSAVASAQITDGTIADADISGAAAISSTKISYVADSISGNAIDGGVISNFQSTGIDDNASGLAMTLNSSGNVGIGTTAPTQLIHAYNGSGSAVLRLDGNAGTYGFWAGAGPSVAWAGSTTSHDFQLVTANSEKVRITTAGNVGIGTSAPTSTLTVAGAARNSSSILNASSTINFATGNLQYTNAGCGAFTLHNLQDGGSYTLSVKGATSGTCSFTGYSDAGTTSVTVRMPPDHGASTASKHTLYNFLVIGTDAYVSWTPGY